MPRAHAAALTPLALNSCWGCGRNPRASARSPCQPARASQATGSRGRGCGRVSAHRGAGARDRAAIAGKAHPHGHKGAGSGDRRPPLGRRQAQGRPVRRVGLSQVFYSLTSMLRKCERWDGSHPFPRRMGLPVLDAHRARRIVRERLHFEWGSWGRGRVVSTARGDIKKSRERRGRRGAGCTATRLRGGRAHLIRVVAFDGSLASVRRAPRPGVRSRDHSGWAMASAMPLLTCRARVRRPIPHTAGLGRGRAACVVCVSPLGGAVAGFNHSECQ